MASVPGHSTGPVCLSAREEVCNKVQLLERMMMMASVAKGRRDGMVDNNVSVRFAMATRATLYCHCHVANDMDSEPRALNSAKAHWAWAGRSMVSWCPFRMI